MNDKVTIYINNVKEYLIKIYNDVDPSWEATLLILEDTLRRYEQIKEVINSTGIYDSSTNRKNPLLSTEKDLVATILKLTQKLGVSPWDSSKIKIIEDDDSEDFIEELIN